jgi:hypothetical protein
LITAKAVKKSNEKLPFWWGQLFVRIFREKLREEAL